MKQYLVVITCDVNDGDYIKSHFIKTEEELEHIRKVVRTVQRLKQSYYILGMVRTLLFIYPIKMACPITGT